MRFLHSLFATVFLGLLTTPAYPLNRVHNHVRLHDSEVQKQAYTVKRPHSAARRSSRHSHMGDDMVGVASYYGNESGPHSASGARIDPTALTAAHRSLPFGTRVRVTNQSNGRVVEVTINDRGPFVGGRIIDLSTGAAEIIGMSGAGVARVTLEVVRH